MKLNVNAGNGKLQRIDYLLFLNYMKTLKRCGLNAFIEKQPKLALKHVLKRITHEGLHTHMNKKLTMKKRSLRRTSTHLFRNYQEAEALDRLASVSEFDAD